MSLFLHYKSVSWDADSPHKPKQSLCHKSRLLCFILAQNFLCKILEPSYTPNNRQFLCSSWSSPFGISTFLLVHFSSFSINQFMVQRILAGRSHQSYGSHSTGSSRKFPIIRCSPGVSSWQAQESDNNWVSPRAGAVQWLCLRRWDK